MSRGGNTAACGDPPTDRIGMSGAPAASSLSSSRASCVPLSGLSDAARHRPLTGSTHASWGTCPTTPSPPLPSSSRRWKWQGAGHGSSSSWSRRSSQSRRADWDKLESCLPRIGSGRRHAAIGRTAGSQRTPARSCRQPTERPTGHSLAYGGAPRGWDCRRRTSGGRG